MLSDLFGTLAKSAWEEGFAALTKFQAREGHCRVPMVTSKATFKLGVMGGYSARERRDKCRLNESSGWTRSDLFGTHARGHGKKALRR